jgi:hypothetical protein
MNLSDGSFKNLILSWFQSWIWSDVFFQITFLLYLLTYVVLSLLCSFLGLICVLNTYCLFPQLSEICSNFTCSKNVLWDVFPCLPSLIPSQGMHLHLSAAPSFGSLSYLSPGIVMLL